MHTHGSILCNLRGCYEVLLSFGLGDEVFLSFLPLSHSYEHTAGQFLPVSLRAPIYYAESVDRLLDNMAEGRPTLMLAVPRLYEVMHHRVPRPMEKTAGPPRPPLDFARAPAVRLAAGAGLPAFGGGGPPAAAAAAGRSPRRTARPPQGAAALRGTAEGLRFRRRRAQLRHRPLLHRPRRPHPAGLWADRDLARRQRESAGEGQAAHGRPAARRYRSQDRRRRRDPRARRGGHARLLARSRADGR